MSSAVAAAVAAPVLVCPGAASAAQPARWAESIEHADPQAMQALGGAVRVLMGLALVYGADGTIYPSAVHAFGLALVAIGVMTLWVAPERFRAWVEKWIAGSLVWRLRVGGLLSAIVGAFLVVAAVT